MKIFKKLSEMITDLKIFDAHIHVGNWGTHLIRERNISPFKNREMDSYETILSFVQKNNIEKAVIVPIYLPDQRRTFQINDLVLEIYKKLPNKIIPGFWVNPSPSLREFLFKYLEIAKENNICVLKTAAQTWGDEYSPDPSTWDNKFKESISSIFDYSKNTNSTIQIHTGSKKSDVSLIEKLIRYVGSGIRFHLVHMGNSTSGHFYLIPRLIEWLEEGLNVICDTSCASGFAVRWLFELAHNSSILSNSILFASDEPWGIFRSELVKVMDSANGNNDLLKNVLYYNALRIYGKQESI